MAPSRTPGATLPGVRRGSAGALIAVVVLGLAAGSAHAQVPTAPAGTITFDPARIISATTLKVDASGEGLGIPPNELPQQLTFALQRGFEVDGRAVKARCTDALADAFNCPDSSKVGAGSAVITVAGPTGSLDVVASLDAYLGPGSGAKVGTVFLEINEPNTKTQRNVRAQVVAVNDGQFSYELRVDSLASFQQAVPPGFTASLKRLTLQVGAARTERKVITKRVRLKSRNGKRGKLVKRRTRRSYGYSLLRTPDTCQGAWTIQLRAQFQAGLIVRDALAPCG